jgi:hypothetical protein
MPGSGGDGNHPRDHRVDGQIWPLASESRRMTRLPIPKFFDVCKPSFTGFPFIQPALSFPTKELTESILFGGIANNLLFEPSPSFG